MKKTLLATAIIGALGASAAAQAATVYDQDGTKLDIYGRIALGIAGGGPERNADGPINNDPEFVDVFSRLGLRMSQAITTDMTAFGHLEWRFRADGGDNRFDAFHETRQSYIGLRSDQYGTIQAGNFDSFYNQFVSKPFDWQIDSGLEFAGHPKQSRGDSIGYYTPELNGFTAALQVKHYSERGLREDLPASAGGTSEQGDVIAAQGGVRYQDGPVTVGLGFVDDVQRGGGNGEMLYGLIGSYDFTDQFTARLGYEGREHNADFNNGNASADSNRVGYDTVGVGGTFTTGPWAFALDYYHIDRDGGFDSSNSWSAGSYYKVSSNFDVFAELYNGDIPRLSTDESIRDNWDNLTDDVYWLTGARYHF
ncbi:hypothetical protein LCGC14_0029970 [marine sediment metagenome]|uniref:Porin domain-containing protein n=1 Tax=marine sediment metagenome TaxID=412755 RepID=A0A0F9WDF4_9ZZZZ|nr:porin [Halomonas sp.]HDZ49548.1 porin [Halomonas sp.]HEB06469.1 porin [Halomonas sp.]